MCVAREAAVDAGIAGLPAERLRAAALSNRPALATLTTMPNLVTPDAAAHRVHTLAAAQSSPYCHFARWRPSLRAPPGEPRRHAAVARQADTVPLDPAIIFERDLARHLKGAEGARGTRGGGAPGLARDVNAGAAAPPLPPPPRGRRAAAVAGGAIHYTLQAPSRASQLGVVAREELLALVGHVEGAAARRSAALCAATACASRACRTTAPAASRKKHAVQNEAIVGAIGRLGLVDASPAVHVEFGAGKGGLTQALAAQCASEHVLVDRFARQLVDRHTRDAVDAWTPQDGHRHLRLRGVPVVGRRRAGRAAALGDWQAPAAPPPILRCGPSSAPARMRARRWTAS